MPYTVYATSEATESAPSGTFWLRPRPEYRLLWRICQAMAARASGAIHRSKTMRRETGRSLAVLVLALLGLGLGLLAMYLIIGAEAADLWLPGGLGGTSDPGTGGEPAATANPTGRSLAYQGADGAVYVVAVGDRKST